MEVTFERYEHHGKEVAVRSDLKGKHREYCLCYWCKAFHPSEPFNCRNAQRLYEFGVEENMTTPVFECPNFAPIADAMLAERAKKETGTNA